jgi:MerR family transcriptional regulator, copper efflux regulator
LNRKGREGSQTDARRSRICDLDVTSFVNLRVLCGSSSFPPTPRKFRLTLEQVPGCNLASCRWEPVQSGELARLTGVSTDALRHYERLGLLPKPPRTRGGYRDYPAQASERVRLIRRALSAGFSLADLTTILKMRDRGDVPCQKARAMGQVKLHEIEQQIKQLMAMRKHLEGILRDWDRRLARTRKGVPARLLEALPNGLRRMDLPHRFTPRNRKKGKL